MFDRRYKSNADPFTLRFKEEILSGSRPQPPLRQRGAVTTCRSTVLTAKSVQPKDPQAASWEVAVSAEISVQL